jgi:hypothetical protein
MMVIFTVVAACDTSSAPAPVTPVDSGNGGGDAATFDSGSGGADAEAIDGGSLDARVEDSADAEADASVADGGGGAGDGSAVDGGDAGACTLPSCLTSLATSCIPSANCIQDDSIVLVNGSTFSCYDNGVTRADLEPTTDGGANIIALEKAGAACYAMTYYAADIFDNVSGTTITITNGSDAGVATLTQHTPSDGGSAVWSVTCEGGTSLLLDPSCEDVWPLSFPLNGTPWDCTAGACTW